MTTRLLLLALLLALPAIPTPAVAADAVPEVVERYAPFVYLHPDERIAPASADTFWERSQPPIEAPGETGGAYLDGADDLTADLELAGIPAALEAAPAYYEYEPGQYIVYWFFYPADRQWLAGEAVGTVKVHEGDWEHVVVRLDSDDEPTEIAYFQHECAPVVFDWDELDGHEPFGSWTGFWDGTHPIAYSALGSHASYWGTRGRLEGIGADCWQPPDYITKDDLPGLLDDLPIDRFDDVILEQFDEQVMDRVWDHRADAVQKGRPWKTWTGPGLIDARTRPWYGYDGLWGPPDAELLSLDPDLTLDPRDYIDYAHWSSGGPGPSEATLAGAVPGAWQGSADHWPVQFGTVSSDWVSSIDVDYDGNVYVAGQMDDQFLMKLDSRGSTLWTTHFGSADWGASPAVAVDDSGNAYVTLGPPSGVGKYSPDGELVWTRKVGGSERIWVSSLDVDDAGSVFILGGAEKSFRDQTHFGGMDAFVQKRSSDGRIAWTRQFGTIHDEYNLAMAADLQGGVVAAGFRRDVDDNLPIGNYLLRLGADGILGWESSVDAYCGLISSVAAGSAGSVYVVGYSNHHTGCLMDPPSAFVHKYGPDGSLLWSRKFGPRRGAMARAVTVDQSGNPYVVGSTDGTMSGQTKLGDGDAFVRAFAPDGSIRWTTQFGTTSHDRAETVAVRDSNEIVVGGITYGDLGTTPNAGDSDAYVDRLIPEVP